MTSPFSYSLFFTYSLSQNYSSHPPMSKDEDDLSGEYKRWTASPDAGVEWREIGGEI